MKIKLNPSLHMFDLSPEHWEEIARAADPSEEPFWDNPVPTVSTDEMLLRWSYYGVEHRLWINGDFISHTIDNQNCGFGIYTIGALLKHGVLIYEETEA